MRVPYLQSNASLERERKAEKNKKNHKKRQENKDCDKPIQGRERETQLSEFGGGEGIGVVLVIVVDREEGGVEFLELHQVPVSYSVQ